jgi:two-component system NarL family sensor kinase
MRQLKDIAPLAFILLACCPSIVTAQDYFPDFEKQKAAAIANLKQYPKQDTARVNALSAVFRTATFLKEREAVASYRDEALTLSRKLNYHRGLASCYISYGNYYKSALNYPKAFMYFDSALAVIKQSDDKRLWEQKSIAHERKGMMYHSQENYYPALDCYFEALKSIPVKSPVTETRIYSFITDTYVGLKNFNKAIEYATKNLAQVEADSNALYHASTIFSLVNSYLGLNDISSAERYLDKLTPFIPHDKETQVNFGYYLKKGTIYYMRGKYENAYAYYQLANKYAIAGGHRISRNATLQYLSRTALRLGNPTAAKEYAMQNLEMSEEANARQGKIDALTNLSEYYQSTGNTQKALEMMQTAMRLKDSLAVETNTKQINILAAIYEADKQKQAIDQLREEKEQQSQDVRTKAIWNKVFFATSIVLLIFSYLGYKNFRNIKKIADQQQEIQQQKINELEKDKQLLARDAMLKGQEEERSRIAKDLHDGLGGFLSGTKLSFMNVKEKLLLSAENEALFNKSLNMLDHTIHDLRKVARNLMPEALVKFGLNEALRDFCESIQATAGTKIIYQQFGDIRPLEKSAEVFIYRIIQELVNNAIKHAEAREVLVQLTMNNDRIGITVEDDGKGFDKNDRSMHGAGLANVAYRVQYYHGTLDIVTTPGNGTSINIELMT